MTEAKATISVSPHTKDRLEKLALDRDLPLSTIVESFLHNGMHRMETRHREISDSISNGDIDWTLQCR